MNYWKCVSNFPFNLIGKSTIPLITGLSWRAFKSWYTGGSKTRIRCCFADRLNQKFSLSVTQATLFLTRCYLELHGANSRTETQFFVPEVGVPLKAGRNKNELMHFEQQC